MIISISANLTALFCALVNPVESNTLSSNWTTPEIVTYDEPPPPPPLLPQDAKKKKEDRRKRTENRKSDFCILYFIILL